MRTATAGEAVAAWAVLLLCVWMVRTRPEYLLWVVVVAAAYVALAAARIIAEHRR